ncbi:MAG: tail fiber domain-containing protein, partial [Synechococcales bacterium]|nr:tail fiber domain-containing protein [Synechococcales bacterium]
LQVNGDLVVGTDLDLNQVPSDAKIFTNGRLYAEDVFSKRVQQLSSARMKENISQLSSQETSDLLQGLQPVKFRYLSDQSQRLNFGFIAEEVPTALATHDRRAIHPFDIVAVLTKAVKDHRAVIQSLNRVVKDQQQAIAQLTARLNSLESRIQSPHKL